ncbi:MAG: tyrosine--tRNA ligase [Candidatus Dormibacteria bacterium]
MADWDAIARGAVNIEVQPHLKQAVASGRPLRVKLGIDPSSPDIHLGHTVVLGKLADFQRLGHQAVLIIGDFTARIGDPSGQSATRRPLEADEVEANAATYLEQVFKVLDRDRTEVRHQSEWFGDMDLAEVLRLAGKVTLAQIITRDDFRKRVDGGSPVGLHELMYPLMQGYDSVAVRSDVELGGTDQLFNLMFGRDLQREHGQEPQDVLTMPLLEGLDGINKMSKSLGNYVGVTEAPVEMFGKLMSVPDALITRYMRLAAALPEDQVVEHEEAMAAGANPRDAKVALGRAVVERFHSAADAEAAVDAFARRFARGEQPAEMPTVALVPGDPKPGTVLDVVHHLASSSRSDARRVIEQGGVQLNGERKGDPNETYEPATGDVWQVGKRRIWRLLVEK